MDDAESVWGGCDTKAATEWHEMAAGGDLGPEEN